MAETRINITARDQTTRAFSSATQKLDKLQSTVSTANRLFGVFGVTVGAFSFVNMIRETADLQDRLAKMSQSTGIAVEVLAGLDFAATQSGTSIEQVGKGVRRFSKIILESNSDTNRYAQIIKALGLNLDNLKQASPEQQLLSLADAIKNNVRETDRAVVITSLFGNEYANLVPLLAQGRDGLEDLIAEGQRYNNITEDSAKRAEEFNDNLDKLGRLSASVGQSIFNTLSPALNTVLETLQKINDLDLGILQSLFASPVATAIDKFGSSVDEANDELEKLDKNIDKIVRPRRKPPPKFNINVLDDADRITDAIKNTQKQTAATRKLTAEQDELNAAVKQFQADLRAVENITEDVATDIERYTDDLRELDRLLQSGLLGQETYRRAVAKLGDEFKKTSDTAEKSFDEIDQFAIQASRNIQNILADGIFDFFDQGLDGMVRSVTRAVGRMAAEFASLRILQSIGFAGFAGASGSAFAGGSGGASGFGIANLGSQAASFFGIGGAGAGTAFASGAGGAGTAFIGGPGTALGGSGVGAGAGFGATAAGALGAGALGIGAGSFLAGDKEIGGLGGLVTSGAGAGVGAAVGSVVPGVGTAIGALAGGVIGGAVNALFGHSAPKFQGQQLLGDVSASGLESGALVNDFNQKGGLFRGDKRDFAIQDFETGNIIPEFGDVSDFGGIADSVRKMAEGQVSEVIELGKLLSESFSNIGDSLRATGELLELPTRNLESFRAELSLASEKGEALTEAAIAAEIERISDEMVRSLLPNIDQLSKHGETSSQTISRLNAEFVSLQDALEILGTTSEQARSFLTGLSAEQRTAFADAAGGAAALSQEMQFFAANFLTAEEQLDVSFARLDAEMSKLGLSADISIERFKELVKSVRDAGGVSVETAATLLDLAPAFINVKNQQAALSQQNDAIEAEEKLADAQQRVIDARKQLISSYEAERSELESVRDQFSGIANTLRDASDQLSLSSVSPLTPGQRREEARRQFNRDRLLANQGDVDALQRLPDSANAFLQASQIFNASSAEFTSDFNLVKEVLDSAAQLADQEASVADRQLTELQQSVDELVKIDEGVQSVEQAIKELIRATLQGPGNPDVSDQEIRDFIESSESVLDAIYTAVREGISGSQIADATDLTNQQVNQATGGQSVSDQQIIDFVNSGASVSEIRQAAIDNGVSKQRLADALGMTTDEIDRILQENNLASFREKTDFIPRTGLAMLHRGEAVVGGNMAEEIKALRQEVITLRKEQNQQTQALINTAIESQRMNADLIAKSNNDIARSSVWREQKVGIR